MTGARRCTRPSPTPTGRARPGAGRPGWRRGRRRPRGPTPMSGIITTTRSIGYANPDPSVIDEAAAVLLRGGLVAFPTETVYGLGADATNPEAVARIFEAKGRPATNPLIVHGHDVDAVRRAVAAWPPAAEALARRFWPGPLTLVL